MRNLFSSVKDCPELRNLIDGFHRELKEREQAASSYYNFDFAEEHPLNPAPKQGNRFLWTSFDQKNGTDNGLSDSDPLLSNSPCYSESTEGGAEVPEAKKPFRHGRRTVPASSATHVKKRKLLTKWQKRLARKGRITRSKSKLLSKLGHFSHNFPY